jgi:hypothetical protein
LNYAPAYKATNWWKSGSSQGTAECIETLAEELQEETIVDNTLNRVEVITRPLPAGDLLARVDALLASLPDE